MTLTAAAPNKPVNTPERRVSVTRTLKQEAEKIDIEAQVRDWKPKTGILDRIKKIKGEEPFVVTLTHDMGMDLLTLNDFHHNRTLTWKKIRRFVGEMNADEWGQYNGDTIKISWDFQLLDGQNRLVAVVLSGKPYRVIIAPWIDPKLFAKMDMVENRTAAHIATILGWGTNANQVGHLVKNILLYKQKGVLKSSVSETDIRNYEVSKFIENNKKTMEFLVDFLGYAKANWARNTKKWFTVPQWVTALYILRDLPGMEEEALKFMERFAKGTGYSERSPILHARRHFETEFKHFLERKKRNKIPTNLLTLKYNVLFTAWNHYINRESVESINIDIESKHIVKPNFR